MLAGEGRGFCSGGDVEEIIGELQKMKAAELLEFTRMTGATVRALRDVPIPVIAPINGVAAGAGSVLALASDFRLLATSASFRFLFTHVGLAGADMGSAYLLPRIVGARARDGDAHARRQGDGGAGAGLGLASSVVDDELRDAARRVARRLADGPSLAYGATKSLIQREQDMDLAGSIELEAMTQALLMLSHDHGEFYAPGASAHPTGRGASMEHEIVTAPDLAPPVGYAHAVLAAPGRPVAPRRADRLGADGTIAGRR